MRRTKNKKNNHIIKIEYQFSDKKKCYAIFRPSLLLSSRNILFKGRKIKRKRNEMETYC